MVLTSGYRIIIFWLVCQISYMQSWSQKDSLLQEEINKIIFYDTDIALDHHPGFIVGIIDHDSSYTISLGRLSDDISDSSVFELGGLSKIFTAHLCHILAGQQKLDLDASIFKYLPEEIKNPLLEPVTVRNLLSHTSGLGARPSDLGLKNSDLHNPYLGYTRADLINYLKVLEFRRETGNYLYSHLNYAILELILEEITRTDFEELVNTFIFKPNGMTHTFINSANAAMAPGHDHTGKAVSPWLLNSFRASEGIKSNCRDLIRYLQLQWLSSNLAADSINEMLTPRIKIPGSGRAYAAEGWHLFKNKKRPNIYLHSGKTAGHAASIHFVPRTRTAVILLTCTPGRMDGLSTLILRMLNQNWKRKS